MLIGVYSEDTFLGEGKGCVTPRRFINGRYNIVGSRRLYHNDQSCYGGRVTSFVEREVGFTDELTHLAHSLTHLNFPIENPLVISLIKVKKSEKDNGYFRGLQ